MSPEKGGRFSGLLEKLKSKAGEIGLAITLTRAVGGGLENPTVQEVAGMAQKAHVSWPIVIVILTLT